jgi:hypothetical protein
MAGLGITISSQIVEGLTNAHDGKLLFKSKSDYGTKVSFYVEHIMTDLEPTVSNPMVTE